MGNEHAIEDWLPPGMSPAAVTNGVDSNGADPADDGAHRVDLNGVDFERLIGLGVSVAQAARFISQRDLRGGIDSIDEIDSFHGLAPTVREILRGSGRV